MFRQWLHDTLTRLYPGHLFDVLVPPGAAMGDYSTNIAFVVAKAAKVNPRQLAQEVCDALMREGAEMLARCEVAGPGFVNVFLKDEYLQGQLGVVGVPAIGQGKRVIVEYSSPNIAKPMHIGHLRSTIIGDALANVYAALGYDVVRWNFIGDWGTQFGKLIAAYKRWKDDAALQAHPINEMLRLYVKFHDEMKEHSELEREGQEEFRKLEEGDAENREIWKRFRELSMGEFNRMYDRLAVRLQAATVKGESDYEADLKSLIERLVAQGLATESEGALIVDLSAEGLAPALLRKSDGATLYLTRDLASLEDRIEKQNPAKILYVVANQQALHFEQLFAVKDKLRLGSTETVHVKFGMVLGEDGKKLATREGKVIALEEVLDEVTKRAAAVVKEKNAELADDDVKRIASTVAVGALKYNDLRQHPYSDIVFDWDAMLDLGGNSGPYLQYTYARLSGILRNAGDAKAIAGPALLLLTHPTERALLRHLLDFGHAVAQCAHLYALNGLALYLYELAELANRYYEQVRINDDDNAERKRARLALVSAVAGRLKDGLALLGIEVLERI
ncbi:MAG: arginine--tRNA ligase [Candidatus Yanofskybacteria bacterium]|nr:arginine--tRNA ligase [Candidatus Yanofskybacteria bacterium]